MCIVGTQDAEVLKSPGGSAAVGQLLAPCGPLQPGRPSLGRKAPVGVMLAARSLVVMASQGHAPDAVALGSRAMQADAFQTTACWWLSLPALIGVGLNIASDFRWADPVAAPGQHDPAP
jgi:hypothetical protein